MSPFDPGMVPLSHLLPPKLVVLYEYVCLTANSLTNGLQMSASIRSNQSVQVCLVLYWSSVSLACFQNVASQLQLCSLLSRMSLYDRLFFIHGHLLYALHNTIFSLPSLALLSLFGSPWIHAFNSHSCSCISQAELVFSLRNHHLETSVDNNFTLSITSDTTACLWPIPFCLGFEPAPRAWLWDGPGSHTELSSLTGQSHL